MGLRGKSADNDSLVWEKDSEPTTVESEVMKHGLYSLCGKYIGHYPVARWLRAACCYLKRQVPDKKWDNRISSRVKVDKVDKICQEPVGGQWKVSKSKSGKVWCEPSSLAIGVCEEIDNCVVEDAS